MLAVLQNEGFRVALVTDGRMSGASGKVPAAIHVTPECAAGGPLARIREGDVIRLDGDGGVLTALVAQDEWEARVPQPADLGAYQHGCGRELFGVFRQSCSGAEEGATIFPQEDGGAPRSSPVGAAVAVGVVS